jgi:CheY-like chemotaxis protein
MQPCTLLIVGAQEAAEHLRNTIFAREGMRLVQASSLDDAKKKIRFAPPDLVVSARTIEAGRAEELCRWFRSHLELKNTPILVLLESKTEADAADLKAAGASQVLAGWEKSNALAGIIADMLNAPLRKEIRVPVEVRVIGEMDGGTLQGLTRDLSMGGAFMEVSGTSLKQGDQLYVRMHLQGAGRPMVAKAECMRAQTDPLTVRVGIRFLHFDKDGRALLEDFLEAQKAGALS